jgi:putative transcriptional regulator
MMLAGGMKATVTTRLGSRSMEIYPALSECETDWQCLTVVSHLPVALMTVASRPMIDVRGIISQNKMAQKPLQTSRHKGGQELTKRNIMQTRKLRKPVFERLKIGLEAGIRHANGEITLKTTIVEKPDAPPGVSAKELTKLRLEIQMSQAVFAQVLNVSTKTVQNWEQGHRKPSCEPIADQAAVSDFSTKYFGFSRHVSRECGLLLVNSDHSNVTLSPPGTL